MHNFHTRGDPKWLSQNRGTNLFKNSNKNFIRLDKYLAYLAEYMLL